MKVTSRELTLLIALASLFVVYLLYTFLFNPLIQDIQVTKDALETARNQKITADNNAQNIEDLKKQQDRIKEELVEKTALYLPDLNGDIINTFMASTVSGGGPALKNLTFSPLAAVDLGSLQAEAAPIVDYKYKQLADRANGQAVLASSIPNGGSTGESTDPNKTVLLQSLTVQFENASYEQLLSQLKTVENTKRAILVDALSFGRDENGFSGSVSYAFYGLDKPELIDEGLPQTPMTDSAGKGNPFS